MNKISRRDGLCIAAVALLLGVLMLGTSKGKGPGIPHDDQHWQFYDAFNNGRGRTAIELKCATCHSKSTTPLSKNHPPKEQCLICHLLTKT